MAAPKKAEDSTPEEPPPVEAESHEPEPVVEEDEDPNWYPQEGDPIGGGPLGSRPHKAKP